MTETIIGAAMEAHRVLGPGLLESAYEECLGFELLQRGVFFERQCVVPINYKGVEIACGFKADVIVERAVVIELKAVDLLLAVHKAQVITYLKLLQMPVGLLINFNVPALRRGIHRLYRHSNHSRP